MVRHLGKLGMAAGGACVVFLTGALAVLACTSLGTITPSTPAMIALEVSCALASTPISPLSRSRSERGRIAVARPFTSRVGFTQG